MVPVLPETAPFSPAQRAWLNGFFAGLLNSGPAPMDLPGISLPDRPAAPEPEEELPWRDAALPLEERVKLAEGRPQELRLMAAMAQLDCGSCGYECRSYAAAIARGEETDLGRCVPGGRDTARMLKTLVKEGVTPLPVLPAVPHRNGSGVNGAAKQNGTGAHDRKNPFPATVLEARCLNAEGSEKDVRHISLDLQGSGMKYEVGDALGVYPENCPDLVDGILRALAATGEEEVRTRSGEMLPVRDALLHKCSLHRPGDGILALLAGWARDGAEADRLRVLQEEDADGYLEGKDLLDLLEAFPTARGAVAELVPLLAPLQPRLYSIASSLKAHPEQVHLTVGMVRYSLDGSERGRKGVASTFLGERCEGRPARVFIQPSHGFRLPEAGTTPVIMVGPGTGIAPFRAFLQERKAAGATGKNWLFFGDQRASRDFLYREELEAYQRSGHLTRLDTAFSRDQQEKVYVQNRMREAAAELWAWLEQGAHFYVCGDAQRMAKDVDRALQEIVAEQSGRSAEEAAAYVAELKRSRRYQRDVY